MAFGDDVGAFAKGLLGGWDWAGRQRERASVGAYRDELTSKMRRAREAADEGLANAEARTRGRGRSGASAEASPTLRAAVPARASTEAIIGGLPAPEEKKRREREETGSYAEGGVVRRRAAIEQEELPPVTPESNPDAAIPANYNDPDMKEPVRDPVRGAFDYMRKYFGIEAQQAQPQAVAPQAMPAVPVQAMPAAVPGGTPAQAIPPQAMPQAAGAGANPQAVAALMRGEGAESNEVVQQARARVDPKGEMPLAQQNAILLEEMSRAYYKRGMIEEGDRASASLLQNFRRNMTMYGAFAVSAAEAGNFQQAAQLLERAYAYIPDGNEMRAQATQDGIVVQSVGPDGRPKGQPTVLRGPEAIRNAVGYALDFDNWAKHLLSERTLNENVRLGEARIAETSRHNRASEGLQAASLAESRAARAERRTEAGSADSELRGTRRAEMALEDLEARLQDPQVPDEEKQRIRASELPAARRALREAEAGMGVKAGQAWSQMTDREQRIELARQKATRNTTGSRDLTFDNRKSIDEAFDGGDPPEGMTPEAYTEARAIAQSVAADNRTLGPSGARAAALAIRAGNFEPVRGEDGKIGLQVNGQTLWLQDLPGLRANLSQFYREARNPAPERRSRPNPYSEQGSGIGNRTRTGIQDFLRTNP